MFARLRRTRGALLAGLFFVTLCSGSFAETKAPEEPIEQKSERAEPATSEVEPAPSVAPEKKEEILASEVPNAGLPCAPEKIDAGTPPPDPTLALESFRSRQLRLHFPSLGGPSLYRGKESEPIRFTGKDAPTVFDGSPRAIEEIRGADSAHSLGVLLYITGIATVVVDIALLVGGNEFAVDNGDVQPGYWLLAAGGIGALLVGDVQFSRANSKIQRAVQYYNEDLEAKILREASASRAFGLNVSGKF